MLILFQWATATDSAFNDATAILTVLPKKLLLRLTVGVKQVPPATGPAIKAATEMLSVLLKLLLLAIFFLAADFAIVESECK